MPQKTLPHIDAVDAVGEGRPPFVLRIRWTGGGESLVDVSGPIQTLRGFTPLRENPALFAGVTLGEYGGYVAWSEEMDLSADTLWRLAREQAGVTMSAGDFRGWRERRALTLEAAARELGLSRRMVAYYDAGAKPIPRTVHLAVKALQHGL